MNISPSINTQSLPKGTSNPRYKTSLCKNFLSDKGCQYGNKCQFAHGESELRKLDNNSYQQPMSKPMQQFQKTIMNYKIVKCKNYEKDGKCKYGSQCSFAHGDAELRSKFDAQQYMQMPIMYQANPFEYGMMMGMPGYGMMMYPPQYKVEDNVQEQGKDIDNNEEKKE